MHLIINPSDIYYLTSIHSHDPGEILILLNVLDSTSRSSIPQNLAGMTDKVGIIFCDARTSALFDREKYEIIDDRKKWEGAFKKYLELDTDPDFLTQTLREKIEGFGPKLHMKKSSIVQKRIIKTPEEVQKLRTSQAMNKKVYEQILPFIIPGMTELEIARRIQILQLQNGASGPSFPPIVAFGENTAVPHHSPTDRVLGDEDAVLIDMGLIHEGYCSDMTRCMQMKNDGFQTIYTLLQKITQEIISWAKPGMKVADLDIKAREMLGNYEKYFTHSLGHGVGIDIHEAPWISVRSDEALQSGMIITIEPGIYLSGKYGARYEEMVLVGENKLEVF
ncbi:M24 family metallopeptidase [Candidatus Gracilibacteria bacterium]|nr:M24 family metallopeptidase [Candidatus Gracilibacteria bacterium]